MKDHQDFKKKLDIFQDILFAQINIWKKEPKEYKEIKGFRSVVSFGKKALIKNALNYKDLYIVDDADKHPVSFKWTANASCIPRKDSRFKKLVPKNNKQKNVILIRFKLEKNKMPSRNDIITLYHELMHHKEWMNKVVENEHTFLGLVQYSSKDYPERNTKYLETVLHELITLQVIEKNMLIKGDRTKNEWLNNKKDSLFNLKMMTDDFVRYENGSECKGIKPDKMQLKRFLGVDVDFNKILKHYSSGACGDELKVAGYLLLERLFFRMDQETKLYKAKEFCKMHKFDMKETKDHLKMVKERLKKHLEEFEKMWNFEYDNIIKIKEHNN
jgi:hypothetical protein